MTRGPGPVMLLVLFLMGLLVIFITAFSLHLQDLWLATAVAVLVVAVVIALFLRRGREELESTD